jgi:hypothetical protein
MSLLNRFLALETCTFYIPLRIFNLLLSPQQSSIPCIPYFLTNLRRARTAAELLQTGIKP